MTLKQALQRSVLLFAFVAPAAGAITVSCPAANTVRIHGGVYSTADGVWLGVAAGGQQGAIRSFHEAKAFIDANSDEKDSVTCSYLLEQGLVDMRFLYDTFERPTIIELDTAAWVPTSGPFGVPLHVCGGGEPTRCRFHVN